MKRWSEDLKKTVVVEKVDNYLSKLETLSKKYRLMVSHEFSYGGFSVTKYKKDSIKWIMQSKFHASITDEANLFLKEFDALSKEHQLCLSNECNLDRFIVVRFDREVFKWVKMAHVSDLGFEIGENIV